MKWKWLTYLLYNVEVNVIQKNYSMQKFTLNANVSVYHPIQGRMHHKPLFIRFIQNPIHSLDYLYINHKKTWQDEKNSCLSIKSFTIQLKVKPDPYLTDIRNTHLGQVSFQFQNQTLNSKFIQI